MADTKPPAGTVYRFGNFELVPDAGVLRRHGDRVRIQELPLRLLVALLEQPGQIVSREVLAKRLWPGNTFVEFDQGLTTAAAKLRQALGDLADNPRFIETVPRRGYRFIAPVAATPPGIDEAGRAASSAPDSEPVAAGLFPRWMLWAALLAAVTAVGVAAGSFLVQRNKAARRLHAGDVLLLSDFENSTGNLLFDETLDSALRVKLQESPFFNLAPVKTLHAALMQSGRNSASHVSAGDALAVCQALAANAILQGGIEPSASGFVLRLRALTCGSGRRIAEQQAYAASPELVLAALGNTIDLLRRDLGEPESSISHFATPIMQATTTSLAALRAFSQGEVKRARGLDVETIGDYKLATDLDPQFALAYARMGVIYTNAQEMELGRKNYQKAFDLREHATERERLYLTSHYYSAVAGDLEKAADVYKLWRQLYPQDVIAPNNLADIYEILGLPGQALEMAREALRIDPGNAFPYATLAQATQRSGRYAETRNVWRQAAAKNLDNSVLLRSVLFRIGFAQGDDALMQDQMKWAAGNPREGEFWLLMGWSRMATGHVREAQSYFHQAQQVAIKNGFAEFAGDAGEDLAEFEADFGDPHSAQAEIRRSLALAPDDRNTQAFAALILANAGQLRAAEQWMNRVQVAAPENTIFMKMVLPMARSFIHLRQGSAASAIDDLKPVLPYDLSRATEMSSIYYRAQALLAAHSYKEANAEFARILEYRALCPISPYLPLAQLGLARSHRLAGDLEQARREYEEFFKLWRDADAGIPIKRSARTEYALLAPAAHPSALQ